MPDPQAIRSTGSVTTSYVYDGQERRYYSLTRKGVRRLGQQANA